MKKPLPRRRLHSNRRICTRMYAKCKHNWLHIIDSETLGYVTEIWWCNICGAVKRVNGKHVDILELGDELFQPA